MVHLGGHVKKSIMIVYKKIDFFSQKTGEKLGTKKQADFHICDFTGEKIEEDENPNTYRVDYNDNDPCFGDGDGESWLYNSENSDDDALEDRANPYDLFSQSEYIFKERERGFDVFGELLKAVKKAKLKVYGLDQILRWSRATMLERVIKEGKYKIEDFLQTEND